MKILFSFILPFEIIISMSDFHHNRFSFEDLKKDTALYFHFRLEVNLSDNLEKDQVTTILVQMALSYWKQNTLTKSKEKSNKIANDT